MFLIGVCEPSDEDGTKEISNKRFAAITVHQQQAANSNFGWVNAINDCEENATEITNEGKQKKKLSFGKIT